MGSWVELGGGSYLVPRAHGTQHSGLWLPRKLEAAIIRATFQWAQGPERNRNINPRHLIDPGKEPEQQKCPELTGTQPWLDPRNSRELIHGVSGLVIGIAIGIPIGHVLKRKGWA